jgi:hypothetical protein
MTLIKDTVNTLQSTKIIHLKPLPIYTLNVDTMDITVQDITNLISYIVDSMLLTYIIIQLYSHRDRLKIKLLACKNLCCNTHKPQPKVDNREINLTNNTGSFELVDKDQDTSSVARTQIIQIERENYDTVKYNPSAPEITADKLYPILPTDSVSRVPYKKRCVKHISQAKEQPGDMGDTEFKH